MKNKDFQKKFAILEESFRCRPSRKNSSVVLEKDKIENRHESKAFQAFLDTQESNEGKKMIAFHPKNSENFMDFDCDLCGRNQPCSYGKIRSSYRIISIIYRNNLAASGFHDSQTRNDSFARNKTNGFSSEPSFTKGKFSIEILMG